MPDKLTPTILVLAVLLLTPTRGDTCPRCYLRNDLPRLVKRAHTIFVGRVKRLLKHDRAEVEVVRVLRGALKPGCS